MKTRILLIEDNQANRYLATFLLETKGIEVIHAFNGKDGVEIARREKPAVIVMDIEMPEMDGYEAAKLLRNSPETANIPIVAATSYAMPGDRAKAAHIGFSDYIEKPFEPDDFLDRILKLVPPSP